MDHYPSRVTLFTDGVYRWSYDLDMWHNRWLLTFILKAISLLMALPALVFGVMLLREFIWHVCFGHSILEEDLLALAVIVGIWAVMILLTLIVYAISAAVMHGTWRLCFEMDETLVMLVASAKVKARNRAMATVVDAVGIAALLTGKPKVSLYSSSFALHAAGETGATRFESVRRMKLSPDHDLICLHETFGLNHICVPAEDYPFVRDFIAQRVQEKARP